MRFLSITYRCFGHFEERTLDVAQGAQGLHLICGANEAGKSTALLGLECFLFGFPVKGDIRAFRYPAKDQRISAALRNRAGHELACVRSRSTKTPLTALDGKTPLGPNQLAGFLAGLTREQFGMLFGLSHDDLVQGGRDIVAGQGGLGQALFAAGAGLAGLRRIQQNLDERLGGLYKPRGKDQTIARSLRLLEANREQLRSATLQIEVWSAQEEALRLAVKRKEELEKERRDMRAELRRLQDLSAALPTIGQLREVEDQLAELPPLDPILAEVAALNQLSKSLGACQKAAKDRVGLVAQRDQHGARALGLLHSHFRLERLEDAESVRLSPSTQLRIRELAEKRHALVQALEKAQERQRQFEVDLATTETQLGAFPPPPEISGLDALRQSILQEGPLEKTERDLREQLATEQEKAQSLVQGLGLAGAPEDALALSVPNAGRVQTFAALFGALVEERRELQRRLDELRAEVRALTHQIAEVELAGNVPSVDELESVRTERDGGIELIRGTLFGREPASDASAAFVARHAPGKHLVDALAGSIEQADAVADEMRRESERVSKKALLEHRRHAAEQEITVVQQELETQREQQAQLDAQWTEAWQASSITPREPAEMLAWLASLEELHAVFATQRLTERRLRQVGEQIDAACAQLKTALGATVANREHTLAELLEHARRLLEDAAQAAKLRAEKTSQLESTRQALHRERHGAELAEQNLREWEKCWVEAVGLIGLSAQDGPDAARVHLDHIAELFVEIEKAQALEGRIQGIDADQQAFLAALDPLRLRVEKADAAPSTAATMSADLDALQRRLTAAQQEQTRRQGLESEAARQRKDLHQRARGLPLDQYMAVALAEREGLEQKLEELGRRQEELDSEVDQQTVAANQARAQLTQWAEASAAAANCRQEQESLVAGLREHVTEYAALNLARKVLAQAIERFRAQHQDSMLSRAAHFFRTLTNGSFADLEVEELEPGKPLLLALRGSPAEQVPMEGLSEGTRDQLFLALRLAGIEEHLKDREPMPLVVDDILVNFDDVRAAATLQCLAELSQQTQVLFFTHHEHLVELAKKTLPADVVFCHRLDGRT